jgi:hypothetical protein
LVLTRLGLEHAEVHAVRADVHARRVDPTVDETPFGEVGRHDDRVRGCVLGETAVDHPGIEVRARHGLAPPLVLLGEQLALRQDVRRSPIEYPHAAALLRCRAGF